MTGPDASPLLLPGFEYRRVDVEGIAVNCAVAGTSAQTVGSERSDR
jgi:hypothetical protein